MLFWLAWNLQLLSALECPSVAYWRPKYWIYPFPTDKHEEVGFVTYSAPNHQGAIQMIWLHFWVATMSCVLFTVHSCVSIQVKHPSKAQFEDRLCHICTNRPSHFEGSFKCIFSSWRNEGSKGLQWAPMGSKRLQWAPTGSNGLQRAPKKTMGH